MAKLRWPVFRSARRFPGPWHRLVREKAAALAMASKLNETWGDYRLSCFILHGYFQESGAADIVAGRFFTPSN
jgi:hypothetical protein